MSMFKNDSIRFYLILLKEAFLFPILYLFELIKKHLLSSKNTYKKIKYREKIESSFIYVNIHEWGGYPLTRNKEIKNRRIPPFKCGLLYQLVRFNSSSLRDRLSIRVSLSSPELHDNLNWIRSQCDELVLVDNEGMDFSGYSDFYNFIKDKPNSYVILTNSSVNYQQCDFLNNYVDYLEENLDVGLLGVSYCTKIYQSLINNNFNPHLQSFFLMTTTSVLREIVEANNGKFPGNGINNKLLLIREGEIKLSTIALKLGYNLGVVLESGEVYKFGTNNSLDNGYKKWRLPNGDMRLYSLNPNKINQLIK